MPRKDFGWDGDFVTPEELAALPFCGKAMPTGKIVAELGRFTIETPLHHSNSNSFDVVHCCDETDNGGGDCMS